MQSKMFKYIVLMAAIFASLVTSSTFASIDDSPSLGMFENQFEKISGDRHYVKPGTIFVSTGSIYLCCEGQFFPVQFVECDDDGIYLRSDAFKWGQCPICHWPLTPWGTCSNSSCPTKG